MTDVPLLDFPSAGRARAVAFAGAIFMFKPHLQVAPARPLPKRQTMSGRCWPIPEGKRSDVIVDRPA